MARVSIADSIGKNTQIFSVEIARQFEMEAEKSMLREAMKDIAKETAEQWLLENRDKIYERLNVDAIANMIMIELANSIKNETREGVGNKNN
jgi:hypothetical protein